MALFPRREPTGVWWRDHSLSLVLLAILTAQLLVWLILGHTEWIEEQTAHGTPASGWPWPFWRWWTAETLLSVLADSYGVLLVVLLTKFFYERGSAESEE